MSRQSIQAGSQPWMPALSTQSASRCIHQWKSSALHIPIVTIWAMNSGERTLAPIEHWLREDALVARPYLDVEIRSLPPGGAAFLLALASGRPLGEAAQDAFADGPGFDLTSNVAGLIDWGVVKGISVSGLTGDGSP